VTHEVDVLPHLSRKTAVAFLLLVGGDACGAKGTPDTQDAGLSTQIDSAVDAAGGSISDGASTVSPSAPGDTPAPPPSVPVGADSSVLGGGSLDGAGAVGLSDGGSAPDDAGQPDGDAGAQAEGSAGGDAQAGADAQGVVPPSAGVLALMREAADYQLDAGPGPGNADWVNKWTEATFYAGVMATYQATMDARYLQAATQWGLLNQWTLLDGTTLPPTRSADNQCAGQTYTEIYLIEPQAANAPTMIANTQAVIDAMIANPQAGRVDWWWCDALFMAPPVIARLGAITSEAKYFQFLDTMWSDASTYLFNPAEGLFWRDSTFFQTSTYWSRGNGWVMAGAVRVLEYLPMTDASRASYVSLLQTVATAVRPLQGADGLWRSDLLHPTSFPNPETSGTSLFCYAMAWSIRQGILDRATYLPVVVAAWQGLVSNVDAQGRLEYVQPTGSQPAAATAADTYDYGVGAFLLAGSEVAKL
jgi:unsaturated rhamnogalacturonyl hydrolase